MSDATIYLISQNTPKSETLCAVLVELLLL